MEPSPGRVVGSPCEVREIDGSRRMLINVYVNVNFSGPATLAPAFEPKSLFSLV